MLALRAFPALVPPTPTSERPSHPVLASLMPALDTAFGLEPAVLFPDAIAALVERLAAVLDAMPVESEFGFLEAA